MTLLMKAAALGVTGAVAALIIKRSAPELGLAMSIAATLAAAAVAVELFGQLRDVVTMAREQTGLSPAVVSPVLKCVGIGVVTRLASDLCKDGGQGAAASAVELCGAPSTLASPKMARAEGGRASSTAPVSAARAGAFSSRPLAATASMARASRRAARRPEVLPLMGMLLAARSPHPARRLVLIFSIPGIFPARRREYTHSAWT